MRTAKALWHKDGLGTAREMEARRAKVIDECLNLPALLEVADAAREHLRVYDSAPPITDKEYPKVMKHLRRVMATNRVRLRAALAKLEEK